MFNFFSKYELVNVFLLTLGVIFCGVLFSSFFYRDPDCFMRAQRVLDLFNNFSWFEIKSMHSNYPQGEVLHWTRPFDILWLIISYPFMFFMEEKEAIFISGFFISPLMEILSVLVLVWGLKPYLPLKLRFLSLFLFLLQIPIIQVYIFTRPDHHSLLLFLSILSISVFLRYFKFRRLDYLFLLGFALGLSVWIAAEGIFLSYLFFSFIFFMWLIDKERLLTLVYLKGFFFFILLLCWLLNPPYEGYFYPDNGRLSILYILVSGLSFLSVLSIKVITDRYLFLSVYKKIGISLIFLLLSVLIGLQFYKISFFILSPFPEEIKGIWASRVTELYTPIHSILFFFYYGFIPLVGILIGIFSVFFAKENRYLFYFFLFCLTTYTILSYIIGVRFSSYALIFAILTIVFAIDMSLKQSSIKEKYISFFSDKNRHYIENFIWIFLCFYTFIISSLWSYTNNMYLGLVSKDFYSIALKGKSGSVLSEVSYGPLIIWEAERPVIGTPYHRNVEGIVDTHKIFFSEDMEEVRQLVLEHDIGDIFLPGLFDLEYFKDFWDKEDKFYSRLIRGENLPCWLIKDPLGEAFKVYLYRVDKDKAKRGCR